MRTSAHMYSHSLPYLSPLSTVESSHYHNVETAWFINGPLMSGNCKAELSNLRMVCKFPLISEHFQAFIIICKLQHAKVLTLLTKIDREERKGRLWKRIPRAGLNKVSTFIQGCFPDMLMEFHGKYYCLSIPIGDWFQNPNPNPQMLKFLYKMALVVHIIYMHPSVYFKSTVDYF